MMNWVYQQTEAQLWTTGHYDYDGKWISEGDHCSKEKAAQRTHYLNGGLDNDLLEACEFAASVLRAQLTLTPDARIAMRKLDEAIARARGKT